MNPHPQTKGAIEMSDDLVRLRAKFLIQRSSAQGGDIAQPRNPDGEEAAARIEALSAENGRMREATRMAAERLSIEAQIGASDGEEGRLRRKMGSMASDLFRTALQSTVDLKEVKRG